MSRWVARSMSVGTGDGSAVLVGGVMGSSYLFSPLAGSRFDDDDIIPTSLLTLQCLG